MRLELGGISVILEAEEDPAAFLAGLLRHLNNTEVAQVLGVTDKTVRHWKRQGILPQRANGQVTLLDLLCHMVVSSGASGDAWPLPPPGAPTAPTERDDRPLPPPRPPADPSSARGSWP